MKTYRQFHGTFLLSHIGQELRNIVKNEREAFKILTGYGATSGHSQSKIRALKSLAKMKKEGMIAGYFPGEVKSILLTETSAYYHSKITYEKIVKSDSDYGNDGIIFVFVK